MLEITEAAADAIRRIREENEIPESSVLRIEPVSSPAGGMSVAFAFIEEPREGDQSITDTDALRVYLAPELSEAFDQAALEGRVTDDGVELELRTQMGLPGHEHDDSQDGHHHH